jgi:1-phosphofructokinase family hexose kinase
MISTVTLNPAIDHVLYLSSFERNMTNRVSDSAVTMGGKGTHVSMNLAVMGEISRAYGFGYGQNGVRIVDMLQASGVIPRFVYDANYGENRVNYLIVEMQTRDATLIASKGPLPTQQHVEELYALISSDISEGETFVLSGDASNFTDPFAYNRMMEMLSPKKGRIFLDASGNTLKEAIVQNPFLIKPNQSEMSFLMGETLTTISELTRAIETLEKHTSIYAIVISLSGEGSLARIGDCLYRIKAPSVDVYNTVGCGDCMMAGMVYGFEHAWETEQILRYATACSAAAAESPLSVGFDLQRAEALMDYVDITFE